MVTEEQEEEFEAWMPFLVGFGSASLMVVYMVLLWFINKVGCN